MEEGQERPSKGRVLRAVAGACALGAITHQFFLVGVWMGGVLQEMSFPKGGAGESPACRPHFKVALPDGNWTEGTKIKRLHFYHVRKAGGTGLQRYLKKVASQHNLKFSNQEYVLAKDPGSYREATLYVTHLRDPVERSISHFKYEGRWNCRQMTENASFVPTEANAQSINTWNQSFGHVPPSCEKSYFKMSQCATNCLIQWFGGSCPRWDPPINPGPYAQPVRREVPITQQYATAKSKLMRYNFIVILELLRYPEYVAAVERYFGVPGVASMKRSMWCERESRAANEKFPLAIPNKTLEALTELNRLDTDLYHEFRDCLDDGVYDFPTWSR